MERVFLQPASSAGSAGVDERHVHHQSCVGELADGPAGAAAQETALLAVDRVIRSLELREPLDRVAHVEALQGRCLVCHHPDSAVVFGNCRQRHPAWREFPDHTVRVVYQRMLRERWEATIFARISQEPPATVQRVMRQIAAFVPGGHEPGDEWLTWSELEKSYSKEGYGYTPAQIRVAWRRVTAARERIDLRGKSSRLPQVRRLRRLAIAPLAADLHRPPSKVQVLDVDDYDAIDGTVLLRGEVGVSIVQVSPRTHERVEEWLMVRGGPAGLLFALPDVPRYNEQTFCDVPGLLEVAAAENESASDCPAALEELIERCLQGQSANVCRYLYAKLLKGGDWPAEILARICELGGINIRQDLFQHGLSKKQVHRCREKLARRLARLGISINARP